MSLLLPARKHATVLSVTPVSIHGSAFLDVVFQLEDEPGSPRAARIGTTEVQGALEPGCRAVIQFVMGVATSMTRVESTQG